MEYNRLAETVGVQLDSSHDGMSESGSNISSAAISARNRLNAEITRRAELERKSIEQERERNARELEE